MAISPIIVLFISEFAGNNELLDLPQDTQFEHLLAWLLLRSVLHDRLNQNWFVSLRHARAEISIWRDDYNNIRPHSALANLAPVQYVQTLTTKGFSTVQNALS